MGIGNTFSSYLKSVTVAAAAMCLASQAFALTVSGDLPATPPDDGGGIAYDWQIFLQNGINPNASETVSGTVGSRSWSDPIVGCCSSLGIPFGWTHTSNWIYFNVQQDQLVYFDFWADGGGAAPLIPAFTIWRGIDNSGGDDHFFDQGQVPDWIDDPSFQYLAHVDPGTGTTAEGTLFLETGVYTLDVGGHDFSTDGHPVGYVLTVSAVSAVPEPSGVMLFGSGIVALFIYSLRDRVTFKHKKQSIG